MSNAILGRQSSHDTPPQRPWFLRTLAAGLAIAPHLAALLIVSAIANAQSALEIYEQIEDPTAERTRQALAQWRGEQS